MSILKWVRGCFQISTDFHELAKMYDEGRSVIKQRCSRNRLNYLVKFFS